MKRIYLFFCFLPITIIHGCNNDLLPSVFSTGNVIAIRNGIEWNAGAIIDSNPNFENRWGVAFERVNEQGLARESLGIDKIKNIRRRQELFTVNLTLFNHETSPDTTDVFYTTVLDDGDVNGDYYEVVRQGNENWIQIDEVENNRVRGRFELHLKLSPNNPSLEIDAEPTIDFVNASFDVLANDFFFEE